MHRVLQITWWPLCPAFAAVVVRLSLDRTCADPYDLIPALTARPATAWPIAGIYLAAHVWMLSAYLLAVDGDNLYPGLKALRRTWSTDTFKVFAMAVILLVEYLPMTVWRLIGVASGCAGA
jgi:hypothetical protein